MTSMQVDMYSDQYECHGRRDFSENGCGDSIDPCSSSTADYVNQKRKLEYQQIENEDKFINESVVMKSKLREV